MKHKDKDRRGYFEKYQWDFRYNKKESIRRERRENKNKTKIKQTLPENLIDIDNPQHRNKNIY